MALKENLALLVPKENLVQKVKSVRPGLWGQEVISVLKENKVPKEKKETKTNKTPLALKVIRAMPLLMLTLQKLNSNY